MGVEFHLMCVCGREEGEERREGGRGDVGGGGGGAQFMRDWGVTKSNEQPLKILHKCQ